MQLTPKQTGYTMSLMPDETDAWAHRPGAAWPCSTIAGQSLAVEADSNGLCYIEIDGGTCVDFDIHELEAIIADHLPASLRHHWPVWQRTA